MRSFNMTISKIWKTVLSDCKLFGFICVNLARSANTFNIFPSENDIAETIKKKVYEIYSEAETIKKKVYEIYSEQIQK